MKAMTMNGHGGVENFAMALVPIPQINDSEVLVRTKAVSINPADTIVRSNKEVGWVFGSDHPLIPGWDISGEVVGVGSRVTEFKVGDQVFGALRHPYIGRTYAEYVAAPATDLAHKPRNVSHEQAAAATLAALTALQPIQKVGIKEGDRVLVTAAGGGVGHFAVQFAKYFGAHVVALASKAKKDFVTSLGADEFVDYQQGRFEQRIAHVDLVIEAVKQDNHIHRSMQVVKPGGSLISLWSHVNSSEKAEADRLNVNVFYNMVLANGQDMKFIAKLLGENRLVPHIAATYPLEAMADAHREIEKGHTQGKIIITFD
nr:NADP-dependent oxidoreductase [uncultured Dyadobacter sp.]